MQKQCSNRMKLIFGNETQFKAIIYNWLKEFSYYHKNLSNDVQKCKLRSAVTPEHIDPVRKLITSDYQCNIWWSRSTFEHFMDPSACSFTHSFKSKKICSWLIPPHLNRMLKCQKNLNKFNSSVSKHMYNIVMCEEIWIYSCEPKTK